MDSPTAPWAGTYPQWVAECTLQLAAEVGLWGVELPDLTRHSHREPWVLGVAQQGCHPRGPQSSPETLLLRLLRSSSHHVPCPATWRLRVTMSCSNTSTHLWYLSILMTNYWEALSSVAIVTKFGTEQHTTCIYTMNLALYRSTQ